MQTEPIDTLVARYYVRLNVVDRPKVLGHIALAFGEFDVSLAAMEMRTLGEGKGEIVFLTHPCVEADFRGALAAMERDAVTSSIETWIRVEG